MQYALQDHLEKLDLTPSVISKTTSSGLVKLLATQKRGMILSPELCDILNKLLKSDEDNATGDIQLLCKLFSGERCSYHYSTEESRVIPQNTPFSILGSTQLQNAAKLIAKMDHGHGLVDRMLIATPTAYSTSLFRDYFFNRIAIIWNGIPEDIKVATTLCSFKRQLKSFYFKRLYNVFDGDNVRSFKIICPKCRRVNILKACSC